MKILTVITIVFSLYTTSIYTKQFTTLKGTHISMSQYQGKKILVVNIASNSEYAAVQLPQLEQLYQQYKDSVVVIGFPSNDFGNESRTDDDLKFLLRNTYNINFPISVITGVKDSTSDTHAIYQWLQRTGENGNMNVKVKRDFQKYLIDKDGTIIGVFAASTNPLDTAITNAITQ